MRALALITALIIPIHSFAISWCDKRLAGQWPDANKVSSEYAKIIEATDLSRHSYVRKWKVVEKNKGPWQAEGTTVVTGLEKAQMDEWTEKVGNKSFGLIVDGLPEANPDTAYLRVRNKFYKYGDIHASGSGHQFKDFKNLVKNGSYGSYTESTFMASNTELDAIEKFLKNRMTGKVLAKHPVTKYNLDEGEIILPSFELDKFTLREESCAGACTSFFNPQWLEHYDDGQELAILANKYMLDATFNAKKNIWHNYRNPMSSSTTIFGIDKSSKKLTENFMKYNSWYKIRGFTKHGTPPDGKNTFKERMTVQKYLESFDD